MSADMPQGYFGTAISKRFLAWAVCLSTAMGASFYSIAYAQDEFIEDMSAAARSLSYRGVMVYARNGEMRSLRVVHRLKDGREQERIQSLSGEPREVLRDEDVVTCILPKDRQVMLDRRGIRNSLTGVPDFSADALDAHYQVVDKGSTRLLDRPCRLLHLAPRDQYRYGYRVWVDEATSLPLRLDLIGEKGRVLEQSMFTQIEFPDVITDEEMKPAADPINFEWVRHDRSDSMAVSGDSHWQIQNMPAGFKLVERGMRLAPDSDIPTEHLLFTDGLATVSVMFRPAQNKRVRFSGLSKMGAVNVFSRQVNGQHMTVMGEVPRATVERIGQNLQPAVRRADKMTEADVAQ